MVIKWEFVFTVRKIVTLAEEDDVRWVEPEVVTHLERQGNEVTLTSSRLLKSDQPEEIEATSVLLSSPPIRLNT